MLLRVHAARTLTDKLEIDAWDEEPVDVGVGDEGQRKRGVGKEVPLWPAGVFPEVLRPDVEARQKDVGKPCPGRAQNGKGRPRCVYSNISVCVLR